MTKREKAIVDAAIGKQWNLLALWIELDRPFNPNARAKIVRDIRALDIACKSFSKSREAAAKVCDSRATDTQYASTEQFCLINCAAAIRALALPGHDKSQEPVCSGPFTDARDCPVHQKDTWDAAPSTTLGREGEK